MFTACEVLGAFCSFITLLNQIVFSAAIGVPLKLEMTVLENEQAVGGGVVVGGGATALAVTVVVAPSDVKATISALARSLLGWMDDMSNTPVSMDTKKTEPRFMVPAAVSQPRWAIGTTLWDSMRQRTFCSVT
ncbi:hypothetical protein GCM10007901_35770 [Dyella acidisoli]|uniref:Uncharacterized protein n=1 Tax=Dyella acidisoli TaxID=1867834 RepID=A0ABQ5XS86_9GAMM|nr:hypothetical protein GCM10007901_35770 [Dyella acidisoli]